jgi:ComF family protein
LAKLLVTKLKFEGAQAAAREMAVLLKPLMPTDAVIVPVPTATGRVRGRGYDQAKLLARALSRETRLPCLDCLVRRGQTHQVGASRAERQRQLHGAFRPRKLDQIRGKHIVLVDDVVTTGATLETAARVLRQSGVARVEAAVFCAA